MPTYEYACKACDHRFEIVQSFAEDALTTCPDCAQDALRKVYNAAGIIFKGDGWHIKDYAGSGAKPAAAAGADDAPSSSSETSDAATPSGAAKKQKKPRKSGTGEASSKAANRPAAN